MTCVEVREVCKTPDEVKDFGFDWRKETFRYWRPGTWFAAGVRVRPAPVSADNNGETGFEYESSGGQTNGKKPPKWPTTLGGEVTDGSITWTARALSTDGLWRYIQSSTWTAEDVSITASGDVLYNTAGEQATTVQVSGGDDGTTLDVVNEVTFNDGVVLQAILRVTIEDEAD